MTVAPTITSERLTLRPFRLSDFSDYAAFLASDRARHMGGPHGQEKAWSWFCNDIAHWPLFGFGGLIIEDSVGRRLGQVAVTKGLEFPDAQLGWFLFDGHEGKGFAGEAALALRRWIYANTGLKSLVSYIDRANRASIALAERMGAELDETAATPKGAPCFVFRHPSAQEVLV